MCLLLVWLVPAVRKCLVPPLVKSPLSEYSLIIASNRDEFYSRPTTPVHFWTDTVLKSDILGGRDATPGKEGGTWLGLSTTKAKIAALVNIPEPKPTGTLGRGSLVSDYLQTNSPSSEYHREKGLVERQQEYPGFQFITLERQSLTGRWKLNFLSNMDDPFDAENQEDSDGGSHDPNGTASESLFVFSNSPPSAPLCKVASVRTAFQTTVIDGDHEDEQKLVEALFRVISCTREYHDEEMISRIDPSKFATDDALYYLASKFSAAFNTTELFGTRTQTVLLVRRDGTGLWVDKNMKDPIDSRNPVWEDRTFEFTLGT